MYIIISAVLIIAGLILKRSKGLYVLQFSWMWIILSFCTDLHRVDYQNYVQAYYYYGAGKNLSQNNSEWGYRILNQLFYKVGFSFETANMIFALIILLAIACIIPKYVKYYNIPASFFMVFPLLLNGIQIRNALSSVIIVWGIQFLLSDKKKDFIKYIIAVLAATCFHATAFFYMILLLAKYLDLRKIQIFTVVLLISVMSIFDYISPFLRLLMGEARFESKMMNANSFFECLPAFAWALSLFLIVMFIYLQMKDAELTKIQQDFVYLTVKVDTLLLVTLPFFFIDYSFERLSRNVVIINYFIFTLYYEKLKEYHSIKYYITVGLSLFYLLYSTVIFEGILGNRFEIVIKIYLLKNDFFSLNPEKVILIFIILYVALLGFLFNKRKIVFGQNNKVKR